MRRRRPRTDLRGSTSAGPASPIVTAMDVTDRTRLLVGLSLGCLLLLEVVVAAVWWVKG